MLRQLPAGRHAGSCRSGDSRTGAHRVRFRRDGRQGHLARQGGVRQVPVALRIHSLCPDGAGGGDDRQLPYRRCVDPRFVGDHRQAPAGHAPRRLLPRQWRSGGDAGRGFPAHRQRHRHRAADLPGRQYPDGAPVPQPRGRGRPVRPLPDRHRHADRHGRYAARHDQVGLRAVLPVRLSGGDADRRGHRERRQGLPARHRLPETGARSGRAGARRPARLLQGRRAGLDQERRLPGHRGLLHLGRSALHRQEPQHPAADAQVQHREEQPAQPVLPRRPRPGSRATAPTPRRSGASSEA